ncbi:MAG: copper homeostasis protein CutC [Ginsengibacter sp.]
MKLEIIGFNIESCIGAQNAGVERIELCANPHEGGTTPSYGFVKAARNKLHIDLYVMIRPRGGDFFYSDEEFEIMQDDITACKNLGCDGVVLGILTQEGNIDKLRCEKLINYAYPLEVTFHRAFDRVTDPFTALEDIINIGCERILTSGQQPKAADGLPLIKELTDKADDRIIIMPGSGINSQNIISIAEGTGTKEFHSSAGITKDSSMKFNNPAMNEVMNYSVVNAEEVYKMHELLAQYSAT